MEIDQNKIRNIVERRIIAASSNIKKCLPLVIRNEIKWIFYFDDKYLLLVFLTDRELRRVTEFSQKKYSLFPGLITTDTKLSAAIRFENSIYSYIKGSTFSGTHSFSLGKDSSIIIQDLTQKLQTDEIGDIEYSVPLAYIISFGDKNIENNAYDLLEDLIAYSIKIWREESEFSS